MPTKPARTKNRGCPGDEILAEPGADPADGVELEVRILVVFEPRYRSYGEAIAGTLGESELDARVEMAPLDHLDEHVGRYFPHLVVLIGEGEDPGKTVGWFTLPTEPGLQANIRVGGDSRELANPGLENLLSVVDETRRLIS